MTRSRDEQAGRSYDRFNIHEMCRQEPELDYVHSKSYGEGSFWFLRVTAMGDGMITVRVPQASVGAIIGNGGSRAMNDCTRREE